MTVVNRFVQAVAHGGVINNPTLIVVHSAETPLQAGYAASIAENWFGDAASGVTTSAHFMVDPVEIIRMLSDNVVSYAVGPNANGFTLNIEQAGRAQFTRAQWTTTDGLTQIGKVGALVNELTDAHGIPLRWATDDQIRAAAKGVPGGVCFHDDIHRVLGGTTHTDPIPNYPSDLLEQAWSGNVQEDDMAQADIDKMLWTLDQIKAQTDKVGTVQKSVDEIHWGVLDDSQGLRVLVAAGFAKLAATESVSPADLAALIPTAIAKQVGDELSKRLAS